MASFDSYYAILAQECILGLGEYPEIIANRYSKILEMVTADPEMKIFVRENLCKIMHDKGFYDIAREIKRA